MLFDDHYFFLFQIATRLYRAASFQQITLMIYLALNLQPAKNQEHPQYVNQLDFCDLYATRHHQIFDLQNHEHAVNDLICNKGHSTCSQNEWNNENFIHLIQLQFWKLI